MSTNYREILKQINEGIAKFNKYCKDNDIKERAYPVSKLVIVPCSKKIREEV